MRPSERIVYTSNGKWIPIRNILSRMAVLNGQLLEVQEEMRQLRQRMLSALDDADIEAARNQ